MSASEKLRTAELLRRKLEHADGLYEQGIPVDELVSLVEAAEDFAAVWLVAAERAGIGHGGQTDRFRDALAALQEHLERNTA